MPTSESLDDLMTAMQAIRASAESLTTNMFATQDEMRSWLEAGTVFQDDPGRSVYLLRPDGGFHRLYHLAARPSDLATLSPFLQTHEPDTDIVTDLIGNSPAIQQTASLYRNSGFEDYTALIRMQLPLDPVLHPRPPMVPCRFAGPGDAPAVANFLHTVLDPCRDRIPSRPDLLATIERNTFLIDGAGSNIEGLLHFRHSGATSLLSYWYVAQGRIGHGVGSRLMRSYLELCQGKRRILVWVVRDNARAIAAYHHYGFREDGLIDQILLRRRQR